ncbi:MAG: DUF3568 family protein [Phycisphaerales bacterium]
MKRITASLLTFTVASCALSTLPACTGTTSTGTMYKMTATRELTTTLRGDLAYVHETALRVLRDDFGYIVKNERRDALEGIIEATTAKEDGVRVETYRETDELTRIEVWVGPLGNETFAKQILSKIETSL